jgi:hypothetical protein
VIRECHMSLPSRHRLPVIFSVNVTCLLRASPLHWGCVKLASAMRLAFSCMQLKQIDAVQCCCKERPMSHLTVVGLLLLCLLMWAADASEPWYTFDNNHLSPQDRQIASPHNQKIQCNPRIKLVTRQMRPLLRRLLLSMVTMQRCKDYASSNICITPPSKFQRHHHCRLLTLSQHSAQTCADKLQCKHPRNLACSSTWRSNIAALQWLFPRHTYCSDSISKEVRALFI